MVEEGRLLEPYHKPSVWHFNDLPPGATYHQSYYFNQIYFTRIGDFLAQELRVSGSGEKANAGNGGQR